MIQIDNKLSFENYIKSLCSKASQQLGALQRISNLLDAEKKNLLFSSIKKSQVSYYQRVWMFCWRRSNFVVNNVHKRALRIVYGDHNSSYSELLMTKTERTIHQQNIIALLKELCSQYSPAWKRSVSPVNWWYVSSLQNKLQNSIQKIANTKINSAKMGLATISYCASDYET